MSTKSKSVGALKTVIAILLILVLIGGIGGLAVWLARAEGLTVYVEYGGVRYTTDSKNETVQGLGPGKNEYIVGALTGETVEYTVEITSNPLKQFSFYANNKSYRWATGDSKTDDYTSEFGIEKTDTGFIVTVDAGMSISNILQKRYGGDVRFASKYANTAEYFLLTVKTNAGDIILGLEANLVDAVTEITVDVEELIM